MGRPRGVGHGVTPRAGRGLVGTCGGLDGERQVRPLMLEYLQPLANLTIELYTSRDHDETLLFSRHGYRSVGSSGSGYEYALKALERGAEVECKLLQLDGMHMEWTWVHTAPLSSQLPLNELYVGKDPKPQHHNTFWEATCLDTDLLERLAQEKDFSFVGESRDPQ